MRLKIGATMMQESTKIYEKNCFILTLNRNHYDARGGCILGGSPDVPADRMAMDVG